MQNNAAALENSLAISYEFKHYLPYDLKILLLAIYSKEIKTNVHTEVCMQLCLGTLFLWDMGTQNWGQL